MRKFEVIQSYLDKDIKIPERATKYSAGYDLASAEDITINPGEIKLVPTGLKADMPEDEALFVYPRSSLGIKRRLTMSNNVGVVDKDYYNNAENEGHIMIPIYNFGTEVQVIKKGERIAQGIFQKYGITDNDSAKNLRKGGFGSSN
ncbi:MAG TPA: dUTP diphosphatase [Acholeplasma sp.]|jgi:dUTP pyrophosphatase|nr:dUTP diphosphatase [Acholeplasma sp.]